jgi:hypothetical protein
VASVNRALNFKAMTTPIVNSFGIMDAPLNEIPEICAAFIRRFDDYQQMAFDQGKHEFVDELAHAINKLEYLIVRINKTRCISPEERNDIRMTVKFTEKMAAGDLDFSNDD